MEGLSDWKVAKSIPLVEQLSPAAGDQFLEQPPVAGGGGVVVSGVGVVSPPSEGPAGAPLGAPPPTLPMVASSQPWVSASVQPIKRLATSVA